MLQMLIAAGVLVGCFRLDKDSHLSNHCSGDKVSDLLNNIIIQTFALYAAEVSTKSK